MCSRKAAGTKGIFTGRACLQKVNDSKAALPDRYQMDPERIHPSLARYGGQESPESSFSATKAKEEITKQKSL